MERQTGFPLFLFAWLSAIAFGADQSIPENPYNLLKEIPTLNQLFAQKGLTAYSADARIEGPITKTLLSLTEENKLPAPEFIEYYTEKDGFRFKLKNASYPPFIRQIINEMFTPVQVFDRVIGLLEDKRNLSWFQNFQANTKVDAKWIQYQNDPHFRLIFTSDPARPIETKADTLGAQVRITKTLAMTFIIEPKNRLIRVLKVDQIENDKPQEKKFTFNYQTILGREMPCELLIEKNGRQEVQFKALYTTLSGFTVFSEKQFQFLKTDGNSETVRLIYSGHIFNKKVRYDYLDSTRTGESYLSEESKAEKLFEKARDFIVNGKTSSAKSTLKKIIKDYPGTTYAEQAKTLLDGLAD